ncbi:MAG: hypothetical protein IPO21_01095 [Bacteroidales bacterium]|nr:hypothetical protein [Bacteroidales bacterium]
MIKQLLNKYLLEIVFTIVGGVSGFLYWKYVGCSTGTCPITSIWYMNTIYGMLFGYLLSGVIKDYVKSKKESKI